MNIVLINLLPHREARRKKRREAFYIGAAVTLVLGGLLLALGDGVLSAMIDSQQSRNEFLQSQIAVLDHQIRDIATLRQEIDSLRARQKAVEDLQSDRNLPVYLFDDLTRKMPSGVQITSVRQQGRSVLIEGTALSQERVADLLRNLSNGQGWLEKPELIEIRSVQRPGIAQTVSSFQLRASLKLPGSGSAAHKTQASAH
jgi:type IV pilus assembly protein PilN